MVTFDFHRTVYFFVQGSPLQFKVCAIFQLSVDFGMLSCFVVMSLLSNTPVAGVQTQGGGHRADMHLSESSLADT